jgi:cytochrome c oxidase subunit 2
MSESTQNMPRRVLIASANPLFARGLQKLVLDRWTQRGAEVRIASSMDEAVAALDSWTPNLVIVDYDDVGRPGSIQRPVFLNHFIAGDRPMQVMLVSLGESGEVVVYDRRTLTPAQAEDWLDLPWLPEPGAAAAPGVETNPAVAPAIAAAPAAATRIQNQPRRDGMKHFSIVGVMTVIVASLTYLLLTAGGGLFPQAASVQAGPADQMVNIQLVMISFLFGLITSAILYSVLVFRARPGDTGDGSYIKGSTRLEVMWTIVPLGTVIALSFLGAQALGEMRRVDPQALQIKVTGFQWGWTFEYPAYGIQSNELWMPVDKQSQLLLTSRDVIHSFWVPEFRTKQDALPGANLVKELRITPNRNGEYTLMCAELCGGAHAYMNSKVHVVSQADFDAWVAKQTAAANADPVARGKAQAAVCLGCHTVDGNKLVGPTWKGLYGSQVQLADGTTVTADDTYLYNSITDPNSQIHTGFQPGLMPATYKGSLTDAQIKDIIEFIKTIK